MSKDHNQIEIERQQSEFLNKRVGKGGQDSDMYDPNHLGNTSNSGYGGDTPACFPAKTLINTPLGPKKISKLRKGDMVISYDQSDSQECYKRVLKVASYGKRKIWTIRLKNGHSISTTAWHSFLVEGKWKIAKHLKKGDEITLRETNGKIESQSISASYLSKEQEDVFNIIVEDTFTFFADGALVHSFSVTRPVRALLSSVLNILQSKKNKIAINFF